MGVWNILGSYFFTNFSGPESACLRIQNSHSTAFTSEQLTQHTAQHKPGLRFTLNEQCALTLRQPGARFCGHSVSMHVKTTVGL